MDPPSLFALLGTGSSASVPWLHCVVVPESACETCKEALRDPTSRNRRNNPSALLSFQRGDGRRVNILIDCGKTFRDTVLRTFPALGVTHLDAVFLTHGHADAFMGLDDLRDVSLGGKPLPIYTSAPCFEVVSRAFAYLVKKPEMKGLHLASLDWRIVEPWVPFEVDGVIVTPLPLVHGPPEPMLGFEFSSVTAEAAAAAHVAGAPRHASGHRDDAVTAPSTPPAAATCGASTAPAASAAVSEASDRVVYLSDLVALPADVRAFIRSRPVSLLVLDALSYKPYPTHFTFRQAVACALDLRAGQCVFTGMNHSVNYGMEDPKLRAFGAERGLDIRCGFDGWAAPVRLTRVRSMRDVQAEVDAARGAWRGEPVPVGEAAIVPAEAGPGGGVGGEGRVPSFRYDATPGLAVWELGQSPSPPWVPPAGPGQ